MFSLTRNVRIVLTVATMLGGAQALAQAPPPSQVQQNPPATDPQVSPKPGDTDPTASDDFKVSKGQFTFDAEGPKGVACKPTVPTDDSGLTIGRGYDLKKKKAAQVVSELTEIGLSQEDAELYAKAVGLKGKDARKFMAEHALPDLDAGQQKELFEVSYDEKEREVRRICNKADVVQKYGRVDWKKLNPAIFDMVVDLAYRGDYTGDKGHPPTRQKIQQYIVANDLKGFTAAMADKDLWKNVLAQAPERFKQRQLAAEEVLKQETASTGSPRIGFDDKARPGGPSDTQKAKSADVQKTKPADTQQTAKQREWAEYQEKYRAWQRENAEYKEKYRAWQERQAARAAEAERQQQAAKAAEAERRRQAYWAAAEERQREYRAWQQQQIQAAQQAAAQAAQQAAQAAAQQQAAQQAAQEERERQEAARDSSETVVGTWSGSYSETADHSCTLTFASDRTVASSMDGRGGGHGSWSYENGTVTVGWRDANVAYRVNGRTMTGSGTTPRGTTWSLSLQKE